MRNSVPPRERIKAFEKVQKDNDPSHNPRWPLRLVRCFSVLFQSIRITTAGLYLLRTTFICMIFLLSGSLKHSYSEQTLAGFSETRFVESEGAAIELTDEAIRGGVSIKIERLSDGDLPPLDPNLINVTGNGGGYRFLPAGKYFERPLTVHIPLERELFSDGGAASNAARTYFWDEKEKRWLPFPKIRLDHERKRLVSEAKHFTVMINAMLNAPDHPSPLHFNPNSIKDLAVADPKAEIDLIAPPQPNNQGAAELTYPLRIPSGRGYTPQLSLSYSSSQSNGWLGMGWDLPHQRVEIDTRWGILAYDGTERYLLNGAALVPIPLETSASCKSGVSSETSQFALRNESFDQVLKCKNDEKVHWEVTVKDGTRFEYGTDDQSRFTGYPQDGATNTAAWFLRKVVDPNGNTTEYFYKTDNEDPNSKGEPFRQKYLERIDYTSHPPDLPATYRIELKSDCSRRSDPSKPSSDLIVSGRTGFKVVTRCLLTQLDVYFMDPASPGNTQLIRRYLLEYVEGGNSEKHGGAFGKMLLAKIRAQGSDSSDFYEHTFEYTKPEFQSSDTPSGPFGNETSIWPTWKTPPPEDVISPLQHADRMLDRTSESSWSFGGGVGVGFEVEFGTVGVGCSAGINGQGTWESPNPELRHIDVNGDGVPDRIWLMDNQVQAMLGSPANRHFTIPDPQSGSLPYFAHGIDSIGSEDSKGGLLGLKAACSAKAGSLEAGISAGVSFSVREADSNSLLADVDGDGRMDLAFGDSFSRGLFNRCRDGNPPDSQGQCSDGIAACPRTDDLCFRTESITTMIAGTAPLLAPSEYVAERNKMPLAVNSRWSPGTEHTDPEKTERVYFAWNVDNEALTDAMTDIGQNLQVQHTSADGTFRDPTGSRKSADHASDSLLPMENPDTAKPQSFMLAQEGPSSGTNKPTQAAIDWGRYTTKRMRFQKEPHLKAEMYRLNPVIRWDAEHDGKLKLSVRARRKFVGGTDGVKVTLLHVTNPTVSTGTLMLGSASLGPNSIEWVDIAASNSLEVKFEDALLIVVDTVDDVPLDDMGNLLDEIELKLHTEYERVCPFGLSCRDLSPSDLLHRDVTGQLAYVFDFPGDLQVSELPRDRYWQLVPPIGPPRENQDGSLSVNRISGTAHKVSNTPTPVYVRIRCESMQSKQADDGSVCPLGTVLVEKLFEPNDLGEKQLEAELPAPWRKVTSQVGPKDPVAIVRKSLQVKEISELNKETITIGVPTYQLETVVKKYLPKAKVKQQQAPQGTVLTEFYLADILFKGMIDAYVGSYENISHFYPPAPEPPFPIPPPDLPQLPHAVHKVREVATICCSGEPQSLIEGGPTYLYDPYRLLFEVDGENGAEVPPKAIQWDPRIEIVSINDLQEVRGPRADVPVVLLGLRREIGKEAVSFEDLNQQGALITYQNDSANVRGLVNKIFPKANQSSPVPMAWSAQMLVAELGELGLQVYRTLDGTYDATVAEYGALQVVLTRLPDVLAAIGLQAGKNLEDIESDLAANTAFCCPRGRPLPLSGALRALVRDAGDKPLYIYDYGDLDRADITIALEKDSVAEIAIANWNQAKRKPFPTSQQALDAVMKGQANAVIADAEFLESAMSKPEIAGKAFLCCHREFLHDINTDVAYLRRGSTVFMDPDAPWYERPRVLFRVHPSRQLKAFSSPTGKQKLEVKASVSNLRKPLIISVTGEQVEGEINRLTIRPEDLSTAKTPALIRTFTTELPEAGLYYVRGYTDAGFDPKTSIKLEANLLGVRDFPHIALVSKKFGQQVQTYEDLNKPGTKIAVEQGSLAEALARKLFPSAAVTPVHTKEESLSLLLGGDCTAIVSDADFITSQLTRLEVKQRAFPCCPRGIAWELFPDIPVPTNLLTAKGGGGHRGQQLTQDGRNRMHQFEAAVIGEVPYSWDPWGGGHHGFFYGQLHGDAKLACIGPYPCEDVPFGSTGNGSELAQPSEDNRKSFKNTGLRQNNSPGKSETPQDLAESNEQDPKNLSPVEEVADAVDARLKGDYDDAAVSEQPWSILSILFPQASAQPIRSTERFGYLALVKTGPENQVSVDEYYDLDNPQIEISVPSRTPAESIVKEFFPKAKIKRLSPRETSSYATTMATGRHGYALIADSKALQEIYSSIVSANPRVAHGIYLCCPKEKPHPLWSCQKDSDGDGIVDCLDKAPLNPARAAFRADCVQDTDGDGIPDCFDKAPRDPEDFDGFNDSDGAPDPENNDLDGDGITDDKDRCPFAWGPKDANGCPTKDQDGTKPPPCSNELGIDLGPDGCAGKFLRLFYPMDGNTFGDKSCFTGSDPTARVCDDGTHGTRNGSTSSSRDATIDGALRRTDNFGLNVDVGAWLSAGVATLGINANLGVGSSYTELEYMDWNGDGLPEVVSPNSISLSGRSEKTVDLGLECLLEVPVNGTLECISYPGIRETRNPTMGLGMNVGGGRSFQHKTTSGGRPKELSWDIRGSGGIGWHVQTSVAGTLSDRLDINGDGLPDVIIGRKVNGIEHLIVRLNLGYRLGEEEDWGAFGFGSSGISGPIESVFAGDDAFERSISRTQSLTTGDSVGGSVGLKIAVFGGSQSFERSDDKTNSVTVLTFSDINGDGLPDLVLKPQDQSKISVRFNKGGGLSQAISGFTEPQSFDLPAWKPEPSVPYVQSGLFKGALSWMDETLKKPPDGLVVSGSDTETYSGTAEGIIFFVKVSNSFYHTGGYSFVQMGLFDATGDGLPDRVLRTGKEPNASIQVQKNLLGGANLLKTIHRPLGGKISLNYKRNVPTEDDPNARWLITGFVLGHDETFPAEHQTKELAESFDYEGSFYDRLEREFYGFKNVKISRGDGQVTNKTYANRDYRLRSVVLKTEILDQQGKTFYVEENQFQPVRVHKEAVDSLRQACLDGLKLPLKYLANPTLVAKGETPCDTWFIKPTRTARSWCEGGTTCKQTAQNFDAYDEFGNITQFRDEQDEGSEDDLFAIITYDLRDALRDKHVVNRIKSIDVRQAAVGGTRLRFRQGVYDDKGNLTRHEVFADSEGKKRAALDIKYDSTGFVTRAEDAAGYWVEYTPDGVVNLFAKETKDVFGLESKSEHDFRFQHVKEQADVNDQKQVNAYDVYGRLTAVQGPYELAANQASLSIDYSMPGPMLPARALSTNIAVIPGETNESAKIRTARYIDAMARPIQSQTDAEINGQIGRVVSGKVIFDEVGRRTKEEQPVFRTGSNIQVEPVALDPSRTTEWTYDVLDRTTRIVEPGNRVTGFEYLVSGHPRSPPIKTLCTKVTDPENKIHYEHHAAENRLVAVVQRLDGKDFITSYEYSPTNELLTIKDALGRISKLEYDLAGRRTSVTTPDTGRLELGYDNNGNLIEQTDQLICPPPFNPTPAYNPSNLLASCGDNQKIRFIHEKNRHIETLYPSLPPVRYLFGDNAPSDKCTGLSNTKGRVCRVEDNAGVELRSYGALGEIVQTVRVMPGAPWEPISRTFSTGFQYDSFGRLLKLIYPDGEKLSYQYDAGGRVRYVTGTKNGQATLYIKDIQYDEFGKRTRLEYGNGVVTTSTYEPETRRLDTESVGLQSGGPYRKVDYDYDKADNILHVTDVRAGGSPSSFLNADRTYTYDDLHRVKSFLLKTQPANAGNPIPLSVGSSLEYDNVGNIVRQIVTFKEGETASPKYPARDWGYVYGNLKHPNLPDSVGPYVMGYDLRGSVLSSKRPTGVDAPQGATYAWDDEGRLRTSQREASSKITSYYYDADDTRLRKQTPAVLTNPNDPADATVYPNSHYTARFARFGSDCSAEPCWEKLISRSKHIHVDGQRLVTISTVVPDSQAPEEQLSGLKTVRHFFNNDPVSSVSLVTDETGKLVQEIDYLPFGEVLFDHLAPTDPGSPLAFRFDGKELDDETGLQYFGARYYDPKFGRWISGDPLYRINPEIGLDLPHALGLFTFSLDNPIGLQDKEGLQSFGGFTQLYRKEAEPSSESIQRAMNQYGVSGPQWRAYFKLNQVTYLAGKQGFESLSVRLQQTAEIIELASQVIFSGIGLAESIAMSRPLLSTPAGPAGVGDAKGPTLFSNRFPDDPIRTVPRFRLVNQNGKWVTVSDTGVVRSASGRYNFVRQGNKIFASRLGGHADIARGQPVQFAGEARFSGRGARGTLRSWNNRSGHYQPTPQQAGQAGLPMDKFQAQQP
jgi:RHS repeat-associated protein